MDLFWSSLTQRASGHTWNEGRSQFSKVHETVMRDMIKEKEEGILKLKH
jgi:hypothetical protein